VPLCKIVASQASTERVLAALVATILCSNPAPCWRRRGGPGPTGCQSFCASALPVSIPFADAIRPVSDRTGSHHIAPGRTETLRRDHAEWMTAHAFGQRQRHPKAVQAVETVAPRSKASRVRIRVWFASFDCWLVRPRASILSKSSVTGRMPGIESVRCSMRAALYARYSSDAQRDASIEDQLRCCRLHADREGWAVVDSYSDRAVSGASLLRPGIQELIADAARGRFEVILTESLDRLSRDQEDIAGLYKRMRFVDVKIVTISEGEVSELHIGLKGTMGVLYLKDLADKTRRGLRGRVEAGKSGGGNSYGYDVVRAVGAGGQPVTGERKINPAEAEIVCRIFRKYAAGKSSRAIAWKLNSEGVTGPFGGDWGPSTIHGNPQRGTGILNNELYIGRLVWNRLRYGKDPDTGKRVSRLNPPSEWVIQDVPALRIVEQELWDRAKERQRSLAFEPCEENDGAANLMLVRRRPKHLFAGLVRCGCCTSSYTQISKDLLGCTAARSKGTCANRLNIRRDTLEASVLASLRTHLMAPELFKEFCEEFTRAVNQGLIERRSSLEAGKTELKRIDREMEKLLESAAQWHHATNGDQGAELEA
jgi:site-specific DNA recombinase